MNSAFNHIDTSSELLVHRYLHGIKLCRPDRPQRSISATSLGSLLNDSFSVFLLDNQSIVQRVNEIQAEILDYESIQDMIGRNALSLLPRPTAEALRKNDLEVIEQQRGKFYDEDVELNNHSFRRFLSLKFPWYDYNNKVIGIFGLSIETNKQNLAELMQKLMHYGLLNFPQYTHLSNSGMYINKIYITKREVNIMREIARGRTAKQIGKINGISPRTVEYHISNIKNKFGASSKAHLIDLIIDNLDHFSNY